jgi:hypothetical protein
MMVTGSGLARGSLMILLFLLAYFNKSLVFHSKDASLDKMNFVVTSYLMTESSQQLLWFDIVNRTIRLNGNALLGWDGLKILAITPAQGAAVIAPSAVNKPIRLSSQKYVGTFAAILPPIKTDLNNDGVCETIQLTAKIDTLFAPGKINFWDQRMPLEISKVKKGIIVFFHQKPLKNQRLGLIVRRGKEQSVTTDEYGVAKIPDVRRLRQGISIVYPTAHNYYISSYFLESYSIFSGRHNTALQPLLKVMGISGLLAGIILLIRVGYSHYVTERAMNLIRSILK